MAEPLTREERDRRHTLTAHAEKWLVGGQVGLTERWEATVQAVEALAEHRLKALDAMHEEWLAAAAERDALARRVEALEAELAWHSMHSVREGGPAHLRMLAALAADDEAAR